MKALVVGASGLLGSYLVEAFRSWDVVATSWRNTGGGRIPLDLRRRDQIDRVVASARPDVVVCAAALPGVEQCELEPESTRRVNVEGTLNLAGAAQRAGAAFVFFSSEYVFDGTAGPYSEQATRNPLNEYGRQKRDVEQAVEQSIKKNLIARVSVLYGREAGRKNSVYQLIDAARQRRPYRAASDQIATPSYAGSVARAVEELVRLGKWGTFHLCGPRIMSRVDFAILAASTFGVDPAVVQSVPTSQLGQKAVRPLNCGLLTDKARASLSAPLIDPEEGLIRMKAEMNA